MSTATDKRSLPEALQDAIDFCEMFPLGCYERWEFAGSIRRHRPFVGDVEHVVIPRLNVSESTSGGLFGQVTESKTINLLWQRLDALIADGTLTKHLYGANQTTRWGDKYRGVDFRGFNHEFFTADVDSWGPQLTIRTGPAEFSQFMVTKLRYQSRRNVDGYVWYCVPCREMQCTILGDKCPTCEGTKLEPVTRLAAPDEQTYFKLCGVEWKPPEKR